MRVCNLRLVVATSFVLPRETLGRRPVAAEVGGVVVEEYGVEALSRDMGLRDASDIEIFQAASGASRSGQQGQRLRRIGQPPWLPPQLLWVTCGNVTNEKLHAVFGKTFPDALASLAAGQAIVEVG